MYFRVCMCVCVCLCVWEREKVGRGVKKREIGCLCVHMSVCECCVCRFVQSPDLVRKIALYFIYMNTMKNKYILDFMYLMPWKFVCNLRFHEVLQTTIIKQITKGKEEIEKIEKYSQKSLELCTNIYVCLCVCLCVRVFVCVCVCMGYSLRIIVDDILRIYHIDPWYYVRKEYNVKTLG